MLELQVYKPRFFLSRDGHECHIFEKEDDVGGVWRKNYDGYALQVPSQLYEFRGFPRPELDATFPSGTDVQEHIISYLHDTNLE